MSVRKRLSKYGCKINTGTLKTVQTKVSSMFCFLPCTIYFTQA